MSIKDKFVEFIVEKGVNAFVNRNQPHVCEKCGKPIDVSITDKRPWLCSQCSTTQFVGCLFLFGMVFIFPIFILSIIEKEFGPRLDGTVMTIIWFFIVGIEIIVWGVITGSGSTGAVPGNGVGFADVSENTYLDTNPATLSLDVTCPNCGALHTSHSEPALQEYDVCDECGFHFKNLDSNLAYDPDEILVFGEGEDTITIYLNPAISHQLGEIVYVELPSVDSYFQQNEEFCAIESVSTGMPLLAPFSFRVLAINEHLGTDPDLINSDPNNAWLLICKRTLG